MRSTFIDGGRFAAPSKKFGAAIAAILFVISLALATFAGISSKNKSTVEAGPLCAAIGFRMVPGQTWGSFLKSMPYPSAHGTRVLTLEQAFGGTLSTNIYYGESNPDSEDSSFFLYDTIVKDSEGIPLPTADQRYSVEKTGVDNSANLSKMQQVRNLGQCAFNPLGSMVGSLFMALATLITSFMSAISTFAFDSNIVCSDPLAPSGNCFNLVGIIGGDRVGSGGLIGALTGSIYMPLMVIAVVIAAFSVGYKGIVKRQFRAALGQATWVVLVAFFGVVILMNPQLIARAPMAISNSISACVIGAFNGENCFTSTTSGQPYDVSQGTSNNICKGSETGLMPDQKMSMIVNNMGCSIWKAFVLQPYSQMNFGTSYENLETTIDTQETVGKALVEKAGLDGEVFCIGLQVDKETWESMEGAHEKRLRLKKGSADVCNIVAYQMYLQNNATFDGYSVGTIPKAPPSPEIQAQFTPGNYDPRWYSIIAATAADNDVWGAWAINSGSTSIVQGAMASITALFGSSIIIVASIFSLVFYLSSIILIAFSPLFMLFAIEPNKGKKIFLGWLEQLVSNLLKYLASAFFVLITIAFYGGILGNSTNPMMTFVFVVIMTFALFLYRKEFISLIGKVNMGGERLGANAASWASGKRKAAKAFTVGAASAAVGSVAAGSTIAEGLKAGAKREAMRGTLGKGAAGVAQQHERTKRGTQGYLNSEAIKASRKAKDARDQENRSKDELDASNREGSRREAIFKSNVTAAGKATIELNKGRQDAQKLSAEFKTAAAAQTGPDAHLKAGALTKAAAAIDRTENFTSALKNSELGKDSAYRLTRDIQTQKEMLESLNSVRATDSTKVAEIEKAKKRAQESLELTTAIREGDNATIDKMIDKYATSSTGAKGTAEDALARLQKARDKSVNDVGNAEVSEINDRTMSASRIASAANTVDRGRVADREIALEKARLHDPNMSNEDALSKLVKERENSAKSVKAVGVVGADDLIEREKNLADADRITHNLSAIESVRNSHESLSRHYDSHKKIEEKHEAGSRFAAASEAEESVWHSAADPANKVKGKDFNELEAAAKTAWNRGYAAGKPHYSDSAASDWKKSV